LLLLGCLVVSAAAQDAQTIAITTKPKLGGQPEHFVELIISGTNCSYTFDWGYGKISPASLDTNRVYTFTVTQTRWRGISIPQLRRVQLDGQTVYDIEVCEVHKTRMELKTVPIEYGLIMPDSHDPSGETRLRLFPHSRDYVLGGCVVMPDSPKTDSVYVCSECQKASAKWEADMRVQETNLRQKILSAPKPCIYKMGTLDDGGTLSGVAKLFYGAASKWPQIYNANRSIIKNPNNMTGEETLTIPKL
jgi:hypothetical protein